MKLLQKIVFIMLSGYLLLAGAVSYGVPLSIVTKAGTQLPTTVIAGSTVTAYYTVTNNTTSVRNGNFIKYLPLNVTQVTNGGTYADTCGATFALAAKGQVGDSCTLQLEVSGVVSGDDSDPQHHLFVCFPGGITCAGTNDSLNVAQLAKPTFGYVVNNCPNNVSYCHINDDRSFWNLHYYGKRI